MLSLFYMYFLLYTYIYRHIYISLSAIREATLESQLRELELLLQEAEQRLKRSEIEWSGRLELLEASEAQAQEARKAFRLSGA